MTLTPDRRRQALSGALIRLAGPLPPQERAQLLVATVREAFGVGAVVVLRATDPDGGASPGLEPSSTDPPAPGEVDIVAGSDDGCLRLGERERADGDGPAVRCARSAQPVEIVLHGDAAPGTPWPRWASDAAEQGWRTASVLPLSAGGPAVGGLVLLSRSADGPSRADRVWAHTLAAVAAAGLRQQRALDAERTTTGQLLEALDSRIVIEQAKGVLAERGGIEPQAAFERMRRFARSQRRRLHDVAREVVAGLAADAALACTGDDDPAAD